jgi:hypothetical protein
MFYESEKNFTIKGPVAEARVLGLPDTPIIFFDAD